MDGFELEGVEVGGELGSCMGIWTLSVDRSQGDTGVGHI